MRPAQRAAELLPLIMDAMTDDAMAEVLEPIVDSESVEVLAILVLEAMRFSGVAACIKGAQGGALWNTLQGRLRER